jgi:long-chain-fatty-acid---luciferin-component ligase
MTSTFEMTTFAVDDLDVVQLDYEKLSLAPDAGASLRTRLLQDAYRWHLEHNPDYARYADLCGATPDADQIDPCSIPLLPSGLFKQPGLELSSVPADSITKWCLSSGTSGSRSIVPRNEDTMMRFLGSITASIPALYGLDRAGGHNGLVLGPSAHEAGDLWFSYVIGCLGLVMQTEALERDGLFDPDRAARRLLEVTSGGGDVFVIGPPARMLQMAHAAAALNPPSFPAGSFLITAGGWKGEQARSIDPSMFRTELARLLRVREPAQIRDSYNMVELNSVLHECAAHRKHVPPWVLAQALDPRTDRPVPSGKPGILAFWDPTATSYPGFILSEDFGIVRTEECPCGYRSAQVEILRRLNTVESRGCALKMAAGTHLRHGLGTQDRFFQCIDPGLVP